MTTTKSEVKFEKNGNGMIAKLQAEGIGELRGGRRDYFFTIQYGQIPSGQWIARAIPCGLGTEVRVVDGLANEAAAKTAALDCGVKLFRQVAELTKVLLRSGETLPASVKLEGRDARGFRVQVA